MAGDFGRMLALSGDFEQKKRTPGVRMPGKNLLKPISRYRSESRQISMTVKTGYQPHPRRGLRGFRALASAVRPAWIKGSGNGERVHS